MSRQIYKRKRLKVCNFVGTKLKATKKVINGTSNESMEIYLSFSSVSYIQKYAYLKINKAQFSPS